MVTGVVGVEEVVEPTLGGARLPALGARESREDEEGVGEGKAEDVDGILLGPGAALAVVAEAGWEAVPLLVKVGNETLATSELLVAVAALCSSQRR